MASSATSGPTTNPMAASGEYFCHQCDCYVFIPPSLSPTAAISCPVCHGGFVEEFHPPNPNLNPDPDYSILLSSLFGHPAPHSPSPAVESFNPAVFLASYINSMLSVPGSPFLAGNPGDYFFGPGLDQLIDRLTENDSNRYGSPPAAKSAVDALPTVNITRDLILEDDGALCAVCKDEFVISEEAKQMPCKHLYHPDCIMPWLQMHCSCPVCRLELPTDDPDYENQRRGQQQSGPVPVPASGGGVGIGMESLAEMAQNRSNNAGDGGNGDGIGSNGPESQL